MDEWQFNAASLGSLWFQENGLYAAQQEIT
jgi:hypothetical protein